ncbi:MAG: PAS domain S-box protein [Candidatus Wallbacteria bacterium]
MSRNKRQTILVAEENEYSALSKKNSLEKYGYGVIISTTIEMLSEIIETSPAVNMILLDVNFMSGSENYETVLRIAEKHEFPLIFLMSNDNNSRLVEKIEKIISYGYVDKNSVETVLIASVRMAFRLFEAEIKEKEKTFALRESEMKYRMLVENSNDVIFCADREGHYKYVNNVFASAFGKDPDYFIGKTFWDVYPKEHADQRFNAVRAVFETGEPGSLEVTVPLPDKTVYYLATLSPVKNFHGDVMSVLVHARNITDRKLIEDALIESEERFKEIFENSLDNIFVIDVLPEYRFKIKKINRAQEKLIKIDREKVEGRFIDEVLSEELAAPLFEKYKYCVDSGVNCCYDEVIELFNEKIYYSTNLVPLFNNDGKVYRIIGISRNITESKKAQLALQESESKHRLLIEYSSDLIWQMAADTVITYASPSWKRVTGYDPQSFVGGYFQPMIHPDDIPVCMEHLKNLMKYKNISSSIQYRFLHSDGLWHWHSANTMPVFDTDGTFVSVVGVSRDITDQKLAEEKIKNLLNEKEFILKEVHHRIKNNMHTISGLLSFQSNLSFDAATRENLADASGRIRSMMVLYDKLYCSEDNSSISIKDYIPTLVNEIASIFSKNSPLRIQTQIEDIVLGVNILTPLGIILNELISNAVKHAFDGCDDRIINISAFKKEGRMAIIFKDNGTGISDTISFKNSSGFGLQLIQMLVKQMKGAISIENQNGTCFNMEFDV